METSQAIFKKAMGTGCFICVRETVDDESVTIYFEQKPDEVKRLQQIALQNKIDMACKFYYEGASARLGLTEVEGLDTIEEGKNYEVEQVEISFDDEDWWEANLELRVGEDWWENRVTLNQYGLSVLSECIEIRD